MKKVKIVIPIAIIFTVLALATIRLVYAADIVDIDHETGDLSQYTSIVPTGGTITVSNQAAMVGSWGLDIDIDSGAVRGNKEFTTLTSGIYRYRFYFDPNSLTMATNDDFELARVLGANGDVDKVRVFRSAGSYQIYARLYRDDGGYSDSAKYNISDSAHYIEVRVVYASSSVASDATLTLYLDGTPLEMMSGYDLYDRAQPNRIQIGAVGSVDAGTSGVMYIDDLLLNNTGEEIGPVGEAPTPTATTTATATATATSTPVPGTCSQDIGTINLVVDPDFESHPFATWDEYSVGGGNVGQTFDDLMPCSSGSAAYVTLPQSGSARAGIQHSFSFSESGTYVFSIWTRGSGIPEPRVIVDSTLYNLCGQIIFPYEPLNTWQRFEATVYVEQGMHTVTFFMNGHPSRTSTGRMDRVFIGERRPEESCCPDPTGFSPTPTPGPGELKNPSFESDIACDTVPVDWYLVGPASIASSQFVPALTGKMTLFKTGISGEMCQDILLWPGTFEVQMYCKEYQTSGNSNFSVTLYDPLGTPVASAESDLICTSQDVWMHDELELNVPASDLYRICVNGGSIGPSYLANYDDIKMLSIPATLTPTPTPTGTPPPTPTATNTPATTNTPAPTSPPIPTNTTIPTVTPGGPPTPMPIPGPSEESKFFNPIAWLYEAIKKLLNALFGWLVNWIHAIAEFFGNIFQWIVGWLEKFWDLVKNIIQWIWGIIQKIIDWLLFVAWLAGQLWGYIKRIFQVILKLLSYPLKLLTWLFWLIQGLVIFIAAIIGAIANPGPPPEAVEYSSDLLYGLAVAEYALSNPPLIYVRTIIMVAIGLVLIYWTLEQFRTWN